MVESNKEGTKRNESTRLVLEKRGVLEVQAQLNLPKDGEIGGAEMAPRTYVDDDRERRRRKQDGREGE